MLKSNVFYYLAIIIIFIFIYPYIFDAKIFLGGDNADYFSLAKGIAERMEYSSWFTPEAGPSNHFPPGYPFILAICMKFGVSTFYGLKIVNGFFLLLTAIITFLLATRLTGNKIFGGLISVALLVNMHLLEYSSIVMSEIPFTFFMLFTLHNFIKFVDQNFALKSKAFVFTLIGMIALIYIRTQGIAVTGAFIFYLCIVKKYKIAGVFAVVIILAYLPWQLRSQALGGSSYVQQLMSVNPYLAESEKMQGSDWGERIGSNAVRYVSKEIPSLIFPHVEMLYNNPKNGKPIPATGALWLIGSFALGLAIFGAWKLKEFRWIILSFFGANFVIFMLWPQVWFGIRFILPLAPLLLIILFVGIKSIIELIIKNDFVQTGKIYPLLLVPFILISFQGVKKLHLKAEANHQPNWTNYILLAEWAKDNIHQDAIVVTRKPSLFAAKSERKAKTFIYSPNAEELFEDFNKTKITHVVLEQLGFNQTGRYLYPLLLREPDKFKLIYTLGAREATDKDGKPTRTADGVWLYEYNADLGFKGTYKDGLKNGPGIYKYANGGVMTGTWVNDTLEGPGKLQLGNTTQTQIGTWKKGKRNGKFILELPDKRIESNWKDDIVESEGYIIDENGKRLGPIKLN